MAYKRGLDYKLRDASKEDFERFFGEDLVFRFGDRLKKLKTQAFNQGTCGFAALRNAVCLQYGLDINEEDLYKPASDISGKSIENLLADGIGPDTISQLVQGPIAKWAGIKSPKVFMTNNGTLDQLRYLTEHLSCVPIIHRKYHEVPEDEVPEDEDDGEGHFEVVLSVIYDVNNDPKFVGFYNSTNTAKATGFHRKTIDNFLNNWWLYRYQGQNQRWYMVFYPPNIVLPKKLNWEENREGVTFTGRYG